MIDPPSGIRALQSDQVLEISWPNNQVDRVPYFLLRTECPCTTCRDEWSGERILDPKTIRSDIKLACMENIGTYAIRLSWNDGHSSGLFSWETLRTLADSIPSAQ